MTFHFIVSMLYFFLETLFSTLIFLVTGVEPFRDAFQPQFWTCDRRSNVSHLKFCDSSLSNEERVQNLTGYLTNEEKISHFVFNMKPIERLQVKGNLTI